MDYVEATAEDGTKIRLTPIVRKIDVTPLDEEFIKQWEEIVVGVVVDGKRIKLSYEGCFDHPTTGKLYTVEL